MSLCKQGLPRTAGLCGQGEPATLLLEPCRWLQQGFCVAAAVIQATPGRLRGTTPVLLWRGPLAPTQTCSIWTVGVSDSTSWHRKCCDLLIADSLEDNQMIAVVGDGAQLDPGLVRRPEMSSA